jgi:hypothetical protein
MGREMCLRIILEGMRLTLRTGLAFALGEGHRVVGPRRHRHHCLAAS